MARELSNITRWYITPENLTSLYAKIRIPEHPQYEYSKDHPPEVPLGFRGNWYITTENPLRYEFIEERIRPIAQAFMGRNTSPPTEPNPVPPGPLGG
jgi:hypothetical protein